MAVIRPPPTPARSPLWSLSFKVEVIQSKFYILYLDINDVWLIGDWLSWPFYLISYYMGQAVSLIRDSDSWIVSNRSWIESLYDGSQFTEILDSISNNLRWLRIDPLGFVRHYISLMSIDLIRIVENNLDWVREKVGQTYPAIMDIQYNPDGWFKSVIRRTYGQAIAFLDNPQPTVRLWVSQLSPFLSGIISGGYSYIISQFNARTYWFESFLSNPLDFIYIRIHQLYPQLGPIMINPEFWIRRNVAVILGLSVNETYSLSAMLGVIILRRINEQISLQRDTIKNLVCAIIIRYI